MDDTSTTWVFPVIVLPLCGVLYLAFYRNRDWAWKERWFPRVGVAMAVLSIAYNVALRDAASVVVGLAFVGIFVNGLRNTRFCHRCGRTNVMRGNPRRRHCSECGLDLQTQAA